MKYIVLFIMTVVMIIGCDQKQADNKSKEKSKDLAAIQALVEQSKSMFGPIPDKMPGSENDTPEKIALGKKLFLDPILSKNKEQSCNTCHNLETAGVDNEITSLGVAGERGNRNSPTVINAGFHVAQFWDGRSKDLAEQAKGPILNPVEMAMPDEKMVTSRLQEHVEYPNLFEKVYGKESVTYDNVADAIAAFERTLISHDRFDDFMEGKKEALTKQEQEGLKTFMKVGCITCHSGPLLGGHMYQKMGLYHPYKNETDKGRYDVTKSDSDKYMFKVPSLRNIALTKPYFHDGAVESLEEAVKVMGKLQLNKDLTEKEIADIVAFLKALDGKYTF